MGLELRTDVDAQARAQHVEQRNEDRQLCDEREAGPERVDLVLLVELHQLLLLALLVLLVLRLDRLHLGLQTLESLHRVELLERQRNQKRADHDREEDDRPSPRNSDGVVEELQYRLEDIDQRLEDVRGNKHDQALWAGLAGLNTRWSSTGSKPP